MASDCRAPLVTATPFNIQNLREQTRLFRCLETGFVATAPALTRYRKARGIDPPERERVGDRPAIRVRQTLSTTCEHCGRVGWCQATSNTEPEATPKRSHQAQMKAQMGE